MSAEARHFRVGLFVLTGIVLIGIFTIVLGGQDLFRKPVLFETYFDESVQGLDVGSPVKIRGVKIGTVSEIGLVQDYYEFYSMEDQLQYGSRVLVKMEMVGSRDGGPRPDMIQSLQRMIDRGLRLRLTQMGITGTAYIEADYLSPEDNPPMKISWLPEDIYVPSAPSTLTTISTAAERIANALENVDVEELVADLDALLVSVRKAVDDFETGEIQEAARQSLDQVTAVLTRVRRLIDGGQHDLTVALENLRVASENLRDLSDTARSYPSLMLLGEPPKPSEVPEP
jgi:phospholipid/cholesterol/gamma-HCH transport system substrate-binding protein/paraquat-inducible protein B